MFFFQAILSTISCSEEERRKVEERTIGEFFCNICWFFVSQDALYAIVCWYKPRTIHYTFTSLLTDTLQWHTSPCVNFSNSQCPSAIACFLLFILNHKLCRQLPAERMKFDIAASVIFKEPESSFERSSFLHVSTFSQRKFHFPANFWRKQWI